MGALADWCDPLPDAEAMRAIDTWAIHQRAIPSLDLMERAGASVAGALERLAPDGPLAILCGKGNNGGDGLVAARILRDAGREVAVLLAAAPEELRGDARASLLALPGESPLQLGAEGSTAALEKAAAIVDALLGTGSSGMPKGAIAQAIELANSTGSPVISVDVPSGVDASTGVVAGAAVLATLTVTFHLAKPGLWINPGKAHAGIVEIVDIGIPRGAPAQAAVGLLKASIRGSLPRRGASSTKFTSGHVLVVGGSPGLTGAPRMAGQAAMRAGAGYVTACVPMSLQPILASGSPELMSRGLPEEEGHLIEEGVHETLEALARGGSLALGPGLGRSSRAQGFARELASRAPAASVIDADALNAHAGRLQELRARRAPTVLTPHAGELGRLLECESAEVERQRLRHVRDASRLSQSVVVLKGDDTLIAEPDGTVAVSEGDIPALATAGTGDVLTGVIAAALSQGLDPFTAACAGVWLHGRAGRIAARVQGAPEGVIASDVIAALPSARAGEDRL